MKYLKLMLLFIVTVILLSHIPARSAETDDNIDQEHYMARFYGVIEYMPEGGPEGMWTVNDREILVTGETRIEEEFGKAEIGAYVEIEGDYAEKTFNAFNIEVKKGKD